MALVNQPPILASSFAVNGDKNIIPTTNSGTEGLASLSLGFPPITQQPVSQGGIPPQRADFNGIFNLITNFLMFIQNGSIFAYSSSLDYQPPAIVYGNNALYRCVATNGANTSAGVQPLSNTSYWQPLIPVGGITVSGNTITVTNETGIQIQYTIDTITNPPSQSDSSNKIVTSAWVKAYAPSKTGSGASGTWNINISGNSSTSTKATQDSSGQIINTTYVKGVTASNATITVTKGNDTTSTTTINNVAHATSADTATKATQDSEGNAINTTYLKLSGGTMTGDILFDTADEKKIKSSSIDAGLFFNNRDLGVYDWKNSRYVFHYVQDENLLEIQSEVTAPTPSTIDNSTKIATTAFVKSLFTASKSTNGWYKEASTGMIWQWGEWNIQSISASASTKVTFPISFPNKCLFVIPSVYNAAEDQIGYLNVTKTGCSFKKGVNDDTIGRNGLYLVIGY